jgi:predicted metal-binding membrane protein
MLLAMMPVLLAQPITHIIRSSRTRHRTSLLLSFAAGYTSMWMAAEPIMTAASSALGRMLDGASATAVAVLVALAWTASPWHQRSLNRGHRPKNLAVFGWRAYSDAFAYGLDHGVWCIAACWAWMLVPLVSGHSGVAMLVVTFVMLAERLAAPGAPRWRRPRPVGLLADVRAYV